MEPLQIVLIVLAVAGVWAVVELAITLRRARTTVSTVNKTLESVQPVIEKIDSTVASAQPLIARLDETVASTQPIIQRLDETVASAQPIVKKLEGTVDEIKPVIDRVNETIDGVQPGIAQIEPLLKQGSIAVEALSADLIEVNGVLRDISDVTAGMSSASNAVTGVATAASEKVQRLFGKKGEPTLNSERTLTEQTGAEPEAPAAEEGADSAEADPEKRPAPQYYTYGASQPASEASPSTEENHE